MASHHYQHWGAESESVPTNVSEVVDHSFYGTVESQYNEVLGTGKVFSFNITLVHYIGVLFHTFYYYWAEKYYKLIAILRRQFCIMLMASWKKIYSVLGRVAKQWSAEYTFFQRCQYNAELPSQNRN